MLWEIHLADQSSRITLSLSEAIRIMICVWVWILELGELTELWGMAEASTLYGCKLCQVKSGYLDGWQSFLDHKRQSGNESNLIMIYVA